VTPQRWRSDLRIVLNARDAASPAFTIAAFEVLDGVPGARRLDAGDGISGHLTDAVTGAALPNVEVTVTAVDGTPLALARAITDPAGEYLAFAPPGSYTVTANGVGYELASAAATVVAGRPTPVDFALQRCATAAGVGRTVPGPQSQAGPSDPVLRNDLLSLAVSAGTDDPQLSGATVGKPLDLASIGQLDQLDWINLPYATATQPRGGNAWQQLTVRNTTAEITGPATVRTSGASTSVAGISVVTTYTCRAGEPWVVAESVFTNDGLVPRTFWIGDALDHDGAGQRSGVAGHGTITSGTPADYAPAAPWIGMTGSDRQTYGLIYEDIAFTAYAVGKLGDEPAPDHARAGRVVHPATPRRRRRQRRRGRPVRGPGVDLVHVY